MALKLILGGYFFEFSRRCRLASMYFRIGFLTILWVCLEVFDLRAQHLRVTVGTWAAHNSSCAHIGKVNHAAAPASSGITWTKDLDPPSTEQVKNAFRQVPGLTEMDAHTLGKDAFGVLVRGFELDRAEALKSALEEQGAPAEVVDEAALMELPPARQLTRVSFTPEARRIDDLLGRSFPLEWKNILVIAAGRTRLTDFKTELVERVKVVRSGKHLVPKVVRESETREERKDYLLLEIVTRGAALRYRSMADRPEALLLFQCLGEWRGKDPAGNLSLFVQDLAKFAPAAVLNHGAFFMRENGDPSFSYPSQTAFYREITWLLWMVSSGRVQR